MHESPENPGQHQLMAKQFCKNCNALLSGRYCSNCGEKRYTEHDKTMAHIAEEVLHFFSHFDGKLLTTIKTMLTRPGKVSLDYCDGIRSRYFKPVSFFLLVVVLYLLFPVFEGLNMALSYHLSHPFYGKYATKTVDTLLRQKRLTLEQATMLFHQKGEKVSKFLLFIILPVMATLSLGLARHKRKLFFDHVIFATEAVTFFILFGFLLVPLLLAVFDLLRFRSFSSELPLIVLVTTTSLLYLYIASKRFFRFNVIFAIIYSLLFFIVMQLFVQFIYKLILFWLISKSI